MYKPFVAGQVRYVEAREMIQKSPRVKISKTLFSRQEWQENEFQTWLLGNSAKYVAC